MRDPIFSVIVTNFNYGRFLDRCLSSVLNQSYPHVELIICDNNSTDNSLSIINKFIEMDSGRVTLVRHRSNLGTSANFFSGEKLMRGDYFIDLGADDFLRPGYLDMAVKLFKAHPSASQFVTHADSIDEFGVITSRAPFFDDSYLIPGLSYAPILMVAGITSHTSQTILCLARHRQLTSRPDFIFSSTHGERTNAMMHAVSNDVIYVREPFVVCRDSVNNETFKLNADVSQIIEQWSIINAFSEYAQRHGLSEISARKDEAIAKLSELCKRYAAEFSLLGRDKIAGQYLGLSLVLKGSFDSLCSPTNSDGMETVISGIQKLKVEIQSRKFQGATLRQISYRPPKDAIQLNVVPVLQF